MKKIILIFCLTQLFSSCSTNIVRLTITDPPIVQLPKDIKYAGILNRSYHLDSEKVANKLEEVLSMEGPALDSVGSKAFVEGILNELNYSKRFEESLITNEALRNTTLSDLPPVMDWTEVERICKANKVDILIILEKYDTDSKVFFNTQQTSINTPIGIQVPGLVHKASCTTYINTVVRIYDPVLKMIYDDLPGSRRFISEGSGVNPMNAIKAITNRKELVRSNSFQMGKIYARRLNPLKLRVSRDYFISGSSPLKIAKRKSQTGNWEGAAELWLKETRNNKNKVAGRACYNMAIYMEIIGKKDEALEWAKKSYENHNIGLALDYAKILRERIRKAAQFDDTQDSDDNI